MSDDDTKVPLPDLENGSDVQVVQDAGTLAPSDSETVNRGAADLEAVFDVPVQVSAVLGRAHMEVGNLLKLGPGAVLELDRKVGEAIDIYVNNRLVARGEVVLVEDKLGVTMTEIIKAVMSACFAYIGYAVGGLLMVAIVNANAGTDETSSVDIAAAGANCSIPGWSEDDDAILETELPDQSRRILAEMVLALQGERHVGSHELHGFDQRGSGIVAVGRIKLHRHLETRLEALVELLATGHLVHRDTEHLAREHGAVVHRAPRGLPHRV